MELVKLVELAIQDVLRMRRNKDETENLVGLHDSIIGVVISGESERFEKKKR